MRNIWISVCVLTTALCAVHATYTNHHWLGCWCNGRSRYCLRDPSGLHCIDCQGNTEGRHCERCKDGFYQQGAGQCCTRCRCNAIGSINGTCDSRGRCNCKEGVSGDKCDQCPNGPIGAAGCPQRRQSREDAGSLSLPCFCYGHSSRCSAQPGFSAHNIASTFANDLEGWTLATAPEVSPEEVHFRWSPKHQDLEVISKNSRPVYLHAPASYLGNQLLSYGQNLSFSLRLDRGVRHPSADDVILEGGGQRVSASLGGLHSLIPSGKKINFSFRLDEQPDSPWWPRLTPFQFQTLLQNLSTVMIRATFGENGRGYLDNVQLTSARRGEGAPAHWVHTCSCPPGYEGQFCERCSAGFTRSSPADGAFSRCRPCDCSGGSCDTVTGDCYSADQTGGEPSCPRGFYRDPWLSRTCSRCPCPEGVPCSVEAGSATPRCERCPSGTTGPRCDVCEEGFYGDPAAGGCRPCNCNGHIDVSVVGSCDRRSGECLRCLNNTRGQSCEVCLPGFYRRHVTDACTPCNCDRLGAESSLCDESGHCRCRPGFEGLRCQGSNCPSCFSPIKKKMAAYAAELQQLHTVFSHVDAGLTSSGGAEAESFLRNTEDLVDELRDNVELLAGLEKRLQDRLWSLTTGQLAGKQDMQEIAETTDNLSRRKQTYRSKAEDIQDMTEVMKLQLDQARADLKAAEIPAGDVPRDPDLVSSLVSTARTLAEKHQKEANAVEKNAANALEDSEMGLALIQNLMNRENKVKDLTGVLKNTYEQASAQVRGLKKEAGKLSSAAKEESRTAGEALKDIANMERSVPPSLKEGAEKMMSSLGNLTRATDKNVAALDALQDGVQRDTAVVQDLLVKGRAAQKDVEELRDRVNVAEVDTQDALRRFGENLGDLDEALKTLNGFDQQIDRGQALADAAIDRLPGVNATIQKAVRDNSKASSIFQEVSAAYEGALGTVSQLGSLVDSLEGTSGSLLAHPALLKDTATLRKESEDLRTQSATASGRLDQDLKTVTRLEADAKQAADGASAAFDNARNARAAVGQTLRDVSTLLANINQGGTVDEGRLQQLEDSVADAQRDVDQDLRPRLRDMEEREAAQRRHLGIINHDIDGILRDIANLDDILAAIPKGCYNSPPIEEA